MSRGFTLVELLVVLIILAIVLGATAPAIAKIGAEDPSTSATRELVNLLRGARRGAVQQGVPVSLIVDPGTGRYWVSSDGTVHRPVETGFVSENTRTRLIATTERMSFAFDPRGLARGDSMVVRTGDGYRTIDVNRWTGAPRVR